MVKCISIFKATATEESEPMTEIIDGVRFEITKKDVKRINIRIYPQGEVRVSAPKRMSRKEILHFLSDNLERIKDAKSRLSEKQRQREIVQSEQNGKVLIFGNLYETCFSSSPPFEVRLENEMIFVSTPSNSDEEQKSALDSFLEAQLEKALSVLVPKWERITGLSCSDWKIKKVKSYWGKCNPKTKELVFNLRLIHFPLEQAEYVVLHELAHLKYPDHQSRFKAFLSEYMSDWKTRAAILK